MLFVCLTQTDREDNILDDINYKIKLLQKLKHFKIPESEYCFKDESTSEGIFVEQDKELWRVCETHDNVKNIRGIFYNENAAYDYLFYLVMKKHVSMKKRWW